MLSLPVWPASHCYAQPVTVMPSLPVWPACHCHAQPASLSCSACQFGLPVTVMPSLPVGLPVTVMPSLPVLPACHCHAQPANSAYLPVSCPACQFLPACHCHAQKSACYFYPAPQVSPTCWWHTVNFCEELVSLPGTLHIAVQQPQLDYQHRPTLPAVSDFLKDQA
jgi:hypothetical protein